MKNNFFNYLKLTTLFLFIFIAVSMIIGPFIYEFWTNNKYELNFTLLMLIIFNASFFVIRHTVMSTFNAVNKNLLLGILELILILIVMSLFYLILYLNYSFLVGFSIILFGSIINLIISFSFLIFFFKKKIQYN